MTTIDADPRTQPLQKTELLAQSIRGLEAYLAQIALDLEPPVDCAALLLQAIAAEPAALVRDGGVIATGFDAELDELRAIQTNCDDFLLDLEGRERARTGITNLRVQFNKVHGFYIEVTQGQLDKVPEDYRRRQTLKNAERFITPELKAFEVLLVDDLSRLSRDHIESAQTIRMLKYAGIRVIGVSDGTDTARDSYKLETGLRGLMSEFYLDDLAKKTHRGLMGQALDGYSAGGLPYGYDSHHDGKGYRRSINVEEAEWVRFIFQRYATNRRCADGIK